MKHFTVINLLFVNLFLFFQGTLPIIDNNDIYLFISSAFAFAIFYVKGNRISPAIVKITFFVLAIGTIWFLIDRNVANFLAMTGIVVRLLLAYFSLAVIGPDFLGKYVKLVYLLSIIAIPLYIVQLIYPAFYTSLLSPLAPLFTPDRRMLSMKISYLVFTYIYSAPYRNSGFMWEPGALGMAVGIAIIIHFFRNGFKFDKKLTVFLFVGLTTQSTTFYISLLPLFYLYNYFSPVKVIYKRIVFVALIVGFVLMFLRLPFLYEKLIDYQLHYERYAGAGIENIMELSTASGRLIQIVADFESFLRFPLGQGASTIFRSKNYYGETVTGASGLGRFLVTWGVFGLFFFVFSIKRFYKYLNRNIYNKGWIYVMSIIGLYFFSNPVDRNPFFIALLIFPFIYRFNSVYANNALVSIRKLTTKDPTING